MKKFVVFMLAALLFPIFMSAATLEERANAWGDRKKYFNIGYVNQTLNHQDLGIEWKSKYGFSISYGRTFYFPKKALGNVLKFGIDLTTPDVTYVKYEQPSFISGEGNYGYDYDNMFGNEYDYEYDEEDEDMLSLGFHQIDLGIHVGPSITVNPVDYLNISTFFHVCPSVSMLILDNELSAQFLPFFSFGGAISYKLISTGIEYRWGSAKYKAFAIDDEYDFEEGSVGDAITTVKNKFKTQSLRFYISLRF